MRRSSPWFTVVRPEGIEMCVRVFADLAEPPRTATTLGRDRLIR
jgi:hypothetical protein